MPAVRAGSFLLPYMRRAGSPTANAPAWRARPCLATIQERDTGPGRVRVFAWRPWRVPARGVMPGRRDPPKLPFSEGLSGCLLAMAHSGRARNPGT